MKRIYIVEIRGKSSDWFHYHQTSDRAEAKADAKQQQQQGYKVRTIERTERIVKL